MSEAGVGFWPAPSLAKGFLLAFFGVFFFLAAAPPPDPASCLRFGGMSLQIKA
jgi:hypothetical protein